MAVYKSMALRPFFMLGRCILTWLASIAAEVNLLAISNPVKGFPTCPATELLASEVGFERLPFAEPPSPQLAGRRATLTGLTLSHRVARRAALTSTHRAAFMGLTSSHLASPHHVEPSPLGQQTQARLEDAPPERRQVFSSELQKVGIEGAKVLREIGDRIKTMRKLGATDILCEVHEAAEELQKKIDRRSYILVNSESWEIGGKREPPEVLEDTFGGLNFTGNDGNKRLGAKSQSETVLDLRTVQLFSKSWDVHKPNPGMGANSSFQQQQQQKGETGGSLVDAEKSLRYQISWPVRQSFNLDDDVIKDEECKTYESASALSLATFASLLIEFVARLQNIVNAFEELAMLAKFMDSVDEPVAAAPHPRLCSRVLKIFRLK